MRTAASPVKCSSVCATRSAEARPLHVQLPGGDPALNEDGIIREMPQAPYGSA